MVRAFSVAAVLLAISTPAVWSQQAADPALQAGARAARVIIDPFPVTFVRGDSAVVRISLVDSVGGDVSGALWTLETEGSGVSYHLDDSTATIRRYTFSGNNPSTQPFWIAVQRPDAAGRSNPVRIDSLLATVTDFAVSRIEIAEPEYSAYSGTTLQLRAKVYSANNTEMQDPKISWETNDPCHARIMPDGAISFGAPAKITVKARSQGKEATREIRVGGNPVATVDMSPKSAQTRVGDVVRFRVGAEDRQGKEVRDVAMSFTVASLDSGRGAARIDEKGFFVAEAPGGYVVRVSAGDATSEALVEVARRPGPTPVQLVDHGELKGVSTRGLAVFSGKDQHDYAYTGSETGRIYIWDVTNPAKVVLTDSLAIDAATIGDIAVNSDGSWALVSRIGGSGKRNGITTLDLSTPAHPKVQGSLSDSLSGGVRNAFLWGNWAFVTNAGAGALDIVDMTVPAQPKFAGRWQTKTPSRSLNEVWGDEKNLYLASGEDGLVILDIQDKGTPTNPQLVSQLKWKRAAAHSVIRAGRYVYIGEQVQGCDECVSGPRGAVRIIDVSKIKEPVEVGRYEVPEAGTDELAIEGSTLMGGFGQGGVRLVDVTGELRGDLYREARQVGWFMTGGPNGAAMASVVRVFKGYLFVADRNNGLWVLRHQRASRLTP